MSSESKTVFGDKFIIDEATDARTVGIAIDGSDYMAEASRNFTTKVFGYLLHTLQLLVNQIFILLSQKLVGNSDASIWEFELEGVFSLGALLKIERTVIHLVEVNGDGILFPTARACQSSIVLVTISQTADSKERSIPITNEHVIERNGFVDGDGFQKLIKNNILLDKVWGSQNVFFLGSHHLKFKSAGGKRVICGIEPSLGRKVNDFGRKL